MRKTTLAFAVSALVFAGQSAALAQSSHSISPKLSTLGAGVECIATQTSLALVRALMVLVSTERSPKMQ